MTIRVIDRMEGIDRKDLLIRDHGKTRGQEYKIQKVILK